MVERIWQSIIVCVTILAAIGLFTQCVYDIERLRCVQKSDKGEVCK